MSISDVKSVPILVISCDRYADLWRPFFEIFWKRWPDCPFPVYLGTNHKTYSDNRVKSIPIGEDQSWALGVHAMLDRIDSEYLILFLEDFLIKQVVETESILKLVQAAQDNQVGCLRLSPLPPPTPLPKHPVPNYSALGIVEPGCPYRVSAQPAIWNVETLRRFLVPGFSPWEFEHIGTQMSEWMPDIFWGPYNHNLIYDHGVEKGKWKPAGLAICKEAGVDVDLSSRGVFNEDELKDHLNAGLSESKFYEYKLNAIISFRAGRRSDGLRFASHYIRNKPLSIHIWSIILFGLLGKSSMAWLLKQHVKLKVVRANRRYSRIQATGLSSNT